MKDAHLTKKEILIDRGIVKEGDSENIIYQEHLPRGFTLNLCGHCTYKCRYCPQSFKYHPKEYIKPEIVKKVFDELGDMPVYVQMGTRGENLLHPSFFDFIFYIKKKNRSTYICLNTNGVIIDDDMMNRLILSGIDHIIFSLQTIRPALYKKMTGSLHHKRIVERIIKFSRAIKGASSPMFLSVQFLGFSENLPYKQEFVEFWQSQDIDTQIQPLHSWGDKFKKGRIDEDSNRYPCPYLWQYPTVTHSGMLGICFVDFYDEMAYGSLENNSIYSLWHGEKAQELRKIHLEARWSEMPMCRNCRGYLTIGNGFKKRNGKFHIPYKIGKGSER